MPKAAPYLLAWSTAQQSYLLTQRANNELLDIASESAAWFAWLEEASSFTFHGKAGSYTARKESIRQGDVYWYAYMRTGKKLLKKYVGKTAEVTLARLEQVAGLLVGQGPAEDTAPDNASEPEAAPLQTSGGPRGSQQTLKTVESNNQRDPLLTTKLHQPRLRSRLVSRSSLVERLQQGMEHALTLVSAPAGFGKTTLLAQWLAASGTPVAWLSLEPEDNDHIRFLTYLVAALQTVDARLGTTALELLRSPQPPPLETVVALLTNDLLRSTAGDIILVLDDYHAITAEPIHRAMVFLLEHLPPQLHLVLASRADPPLPLARLRARGQLTEVRVAELRLSTARPRPFSRK